MRFNIPQKIYNCPGTRRLPVYVRRGDEASPALGRQDEDFTLAHSQEQSDASAAAVRVVSACPHSRFVQLLQIKIKIWTTFLEHSLLSKLSRCV